MSADRGPHPPVNTADLLSLDRWAANGEWGMANGGIPFGSWPVSSSFFNRSLSMNRPSLPPSPSAAKRRWERVGVRAPLPGSRSQCVSILWKTCLPMNYPFPGRAHSVVPALRRRPRQALAFVWGLFTLFLLLPLASPALEPPPNAHLHWAYQTPKPVTPPAVTNTGWPRNDIDRFILARLEAEGLQPAPPADPRTFVRRVSASLTGLPPTFEEVQHFAAEAHPGGSSTQALDPSAVYRLAQRLLDSPHYGERWGRHWLDVARYSDTKGYVYGREERRFVHASTYRDWVVQAFNNDIPYDRFLLLQIAGDQLVPADSPDLAAMGFITGGRRFLGVTHDIIDDRIDVVTRGTLGLTVQCARCHDHKYDPIPIQDYYSLYGVFHGVDVQLVPLQPSKDAELAKRRKAFADGYAKHRDAANTRLKTRIADYLTAQLELHQYPEEGFDQLLSADDIIPTSVRRWRDYLLTHRSTAHPVFGPWHALAALDASSFTNHAQAVLAPVLAQTQLNPLVVEAFATSPDSMRDVASRYGDVFTKAEKQPDLPGAAGLLAFLANPESPALVPDTGIVNTETFFPTPVTEELWKLQGDVDRHLMELGMPAALILTDRTQEPNPRVFQRGSPSRLGEPVHRQFLGVLSKENRQPFQKGSGRLELARAIVDPANPLAARVMVNRIWQHHFGKGLVPTPSDFGLRAEAPSHPELLDWLACRFIAEGWSVKAMHRLIVSSATYQQGHGFPMRRLDFEQLRDAMLAASGQLDRSVGGRAKELLDPTNLRRTLYSTVDRQFLPGTFRTFDFANPDIHVAVRHETTVPQQALFFLNGRFAASRAIALAVTATATHALAPARVQALYRSVYQREPTPHETEIAFAFIEAAAENAPPPPEPVRVTPWSYGTGEFDAIARQTKSFTALPHFTGLAWQGSEAWPGGDTGWAQLTATGGHPGNTPTHACIRRWTAPAEVTVKITGTLQHDPEAGDGVRAFVVSSRHGELKAVTAHHSKVEVTLDAVELQAGDTLDFIVDIGSVLNSDQFLWAPVVAGDDGTWNGREDFTGPKPHPVRLEPWQQYAQVLLLSNEFAFTD